MDFSAANGCASHHVTQAVRRSGAHGSANTVFSLAGEGGLAISVIQTLAIREQFAATISTARPIFAAAIIDALRTINADNASFLT